MKNGAAHSVYRNSTMCVIENDVQIVLYDKLGHRSLSNEKFASIRKFIDLKSNIEFIICIFTTKSPVFQLVILMLAII